MSYKQEIEIDSTYASYYDEDHPTRVGFTTKCPNCGNIFYTPYVDVEDDFFTVDMACDTCKKEFVTVKCDSTSSKPSVEFLDRLIPKPEDLKTFKENNK